eukprot:12224941-Prorocentrum_lima.AAC.1
MATRATNLVRTPVPQEKESGRHGDVQGLTVEGPNFVPGGAGARHLRARGAGSAAACCCPH